jgi:hypothetical protein
MFKFDFAFSLSPVRIFPVFLSLVGPFQAETVFLLGKIN